MASRSRQRRLVVWLGSSAVVLAGAAVVLERESMTRFCREEWLLLRLRLGDDQEQRLAANALGDLVAVRAIKPLLELAGRRLVVLESAPLGSSCFPPLSNEDALGAVLRDDDPFRLALVSILWRDVRRSLPRVVTAVRAGDWKTRCIAIHLLGKLRREELPVEAILAIEAAAGEADERVAHVARDVLAAQGLLPHQP